ncbi:Mo25 family protein [Quillaja saponaria]|uniref:Mo25 family protein n=1 Tax=Quillaja saponaria TaxID=32244 RepID=A0AAD7VKF3_QUISA|nr:Mo25 family protein [Quillaja saponaria]
MKNIFHVKVKPKHKKPIDLVHHLHTLLLTFTNQTINRTTTKQQGKKLALDRELVNLLEELQWILYGDSETLPNPKAGIEITLEFFSEKMIKVNPFRLLITCFSNLEWQFQLYVSRIVANLLCQHIDSQFVAAQFLEQNPDLVDLLFAQYLIFNLDDNVPVALLYGVMVRECIRRSRVIAKHLLDSKENMKKFFECVRFPNFTFAAHVEGTLELLLTRHKVVVADFFSRNYDWFFNEFNSKLLLCSNPNHELAKSQALKLLGEILGNQTNNYDVMIWYTSCADNLKILMSCLRESKLIQLEAFKVYKLFVENPKKPKGVVDMLKLNKSKLLTFLDGFKVDNKMDEQFEEDERKVMKDIDGLDEETNFRQDSHVGQLRMFTITV